MAKAEPFLADIAKSKLKTRTLSYQDGLRFGLGFVVANLLVATVVGGITWGVVYAFHLN